MRKLSILSMLLQERARMVEEHKRNIVDYKAFLESCDFIKVNGEHYPSTILGIFSSYGWRYKFSPSVQNMQANSQWRKVQDRLESDPRCSHLEKIDRLQIFQVWFLLLVFNFSFWMLYFTFTMLQDYVNDLEKEEEEQRKIKKVHSSLS